MNIPNGFKLVPVEPTEEMIYAMATAIHLSKTSAQVYFELIAAAPATPQPIYYEARERAVVLEGLLRLARQFVTNGVELGYITMPDQETPDAAHDLVPMIDAALKPEEGGGDEWES